MVGCNWRAARRDHDDDATSLPPMVWFFHRKTIAQYVAVLKKNDGATYRRHGFAHTHTYIYIFVAGSFLRYPRWNSVNDRHVVRRGGGGKKEEPTSPPSPAVVVYDLRLKFASCNGSILHPLRVVHHSTVAHPFFSF